MKRFRWARDEGPRRHLILGGAIMAILALGTVAGAARIQDSFRRSEPVAAPAGFPAAIPAGMSSPGMPYPGLNYEGDRLGEEAATPLLQNATRSTFTPETAGDARVIAFSNGIRFDTRNGQPALPADLTIQAYPASRPGYYIVQFEGPVMTEWRQSLERAGAEIIAYLPSYTYIVKLDNAEFAAVRALPHVVWTGLYQPAYKLSGQPELAADGPARLDVVVMLFPGESLDAVTSAITATGGVVRDTARSRNLLVRATMDHEAARELATRPDVAWIEPWHPSRPDNNRTQWVLQTFISENRKVWDNGITGSGQVLSEGDSGILTSHNNFRDAAISITDFGDYPTHRKIIAYKKALEYPGILFGDGAAHSWHGTHTNGTSVGNDAPFGIDGRDGMAKDAKTYFLDMGGSAADSFFTPVDMYSMWLMPYNGNAGGAARISSNSWGAAVIGAIYDTQAMQVDQFMWDHKDFLLFFSTGNSGPTGHTCGSPATAKDCVSVGGTLNDLSATSIYSATSRGPTGDNRHKPTLCTPAIAGSSVGPSATSYGVLQGTSMACPAAAGTTALVRQYLMEGRYPSGIAEPAHAFTPTAALLKAMMINCGQNDMPAFQVPNDSTGWGRSKIDDVLYFSGDTRQTIVLDETDGLGTGEYAEYEFWVSDTSLPLKISLVWTDYPGTPGSGGAMLVNNLNLSATGGSATYLGNVFTAGQSVTGGRADSLNVEECVWRTTPAAGLWRIRVDGTNVPMGPQPFALVVSGGLGGNAGIVRLDRSFYGTGDTLGIRVEDLNAGSTVTVQVKSTTETTPENVVLGQIIATPGGVYTGTFPLTLLARQTGDGRLSVSHNDTVTVSYTDSSPAHTSNARARIFLNAPTITAVNALDIGSTAATLGWTTSTAATSRLYYGTSPSLGSSTTLDPSLVTSHSVPVSGLAANTTYYYDVESADHYGNTVRDDNGGAHYRFTTRVRGDVLLVYGDNTFIEQSKYEAAFARNGWTFDKWNEGQALNPPVGNLSTGLRSYRAIWWQVGWEQYPCFTDAARDSLSAYDAGGGRISIVSHDVAWDFSDPTSPDYSAARLAWYNSELHEIWNQDPTSWTANRGVIGDPISGAYLTNIPYTSFRSGGAGDQITSNPGSGTGAVCWVRQQPTPPLNCALRWTSAGPLGTPGSGVWGGTPTQQVVNNYEWSRLNAATADDTTRAGILDKTLIWLVGRDHPTVTVTSPNGGEVITTSPVSIAWNETFDGASAGTRRVEYSDDGGQSWILISAAAGASPYSWDITSVPNSNQVRVRVTVVDNGSPTLTGQDQSNANFTLNRAGGDTRGPVVVAGTMLTSPNPVVAPGNFILFATVDDSRTGNSNVTQAEWSLGAMAAAPGTGTAMSGVFTSPTVAVRDTIDASTFPGGMVPLWIRGRDAAGAWGPADSMTVIDNGGRTSVASIAGPAVFGLDQNAPNPFNPVTSIKFGLAESGAASLVVYDVNGRMVRTLVNGIVSAGRHEVRWDGRDNQNHGVASGVYFYRLESAGRSAQQKMVLMK